MNKQQTLHIAYATDSGFLVPTCVSIFSLCENVSKDREVVIHVIVNGTVSNAGIDILKKTTNLFINVTIDVLKVDDIDAKITIPRISSMTYQRLFLSEHLPNISKIVYLDADTIVSGDISELYDYHMCEKHYIAGVVDYYETDAYSTHLGFKHKMQYLNAGVLVMNLEEMRKDKLQVIFERLLQTGYQYQDQDVINISCYGRKTVIPPKFNFKPMQFYWCGVKCLEHMTKSDISDGFRKPVVVHFGFEIKPWENTEYDWQNRWHYYYEKISDVIPSVTDFLTAAKSNEKNNLTYRDIDDNKLIIYGAGVFTSRLLGQINLLGARRPDVIWDIEADSISKLQNIPVEVPQLDDDNIKKDSIIIVCIENNDLRLRLIDMLTKKGFDKVYEAYKYSLLLWESMI